MGIHLDTIHLYSVLEVYIQHMNITKLFTKFEYKERFQKWKENLSCFFTFIDKDTFSYLFKFFSSKNF